MRRFYSVLIVAVFLWQANIAVGQKFDKERLMSISSKEEKKYREIQKKLQGLEIPKFIEYDDGRVAELVDYENGMPVYLVSHNEQARITTGVEFTQSPDGLNLPLLGKDITIGIWEAESQAVRADHQELVGRVIIMDADSPGNHATHVAGTMIAAGVNAEARGMLPEARLRSYNTGSDVSEMADEAADGLILSNHSYGFDFGWAGGGWTGGDSNVDLRFGHYNARSRSIDQIAYNAPYYLSVWSSGNQRNDSGDGPQASDGPYNCIDYSSAAKNNLVVGAITGFNEYTGPESAVMSSFSSWGPTRDGRIRPDVVGDGVAVFSTGADAEDAYYSSQGTSMSAPNVTGTLGMIQQYQLDVDGEFMKAAALRSLIIHTAREAGAHPGPDYSFGWGVVNAVDAIEVIRDRNALDTVITTSVLGNGQTHEYFLFSDGESPIKSTISWTDVPGSPVELGDTSPMLVNDLDIRIYDENNNEVQPWVLNPNAPAIRAERGDNTLDNVEQVLLDNPDKRMYRIVVSHKGALENGSQEYGLVYTGSALKRTGLTYEWNTSGGDLTVGNNWTNESGIVDPTSFELTGSSLVFTNNASLSSSDTISLSENVSVENLIWLSDAASVIDLKGNSLTITNQIFSINSDLSIVNGSLILESAGSGDVDVGFNTIDCPLVIRQGNYTLENLAGITSIKVESGNLAINEEQITLSTLEILADASATITNSDIFLSGNASVESSSLDFIGTSFNLSGSVFTSNGTTIKGSELVLDGINSLIGNFDFLKVTLTGDVVNAGKFMSDSLNLIAPLNLNIGESDTILIRKHWTVDQSSAPEISISGFSAGGPAVFDIDYRDVICFDNITIENIVLETGSVVNFGTTSNLSNVVGAVELACEDIVFSNFRVENTCSSSAVDLIDLSKGSIDNYQWTVLRDGAEVQSSVSESPYLFIGDPGTYSISLTVSNDVLEESYTVQFNVIENDLGPIQLVENNDGLVATLVLDEYQWYFEDELTDFTTRLISPNREGTYRVGYRSSTSESGCTNTVSNSYIFVVAGIDEETGTILYPNPVSDILNFKSNRKISSISFADLQGRVVKNYRVRNESQLNISDLPKGMYNVVVLFQDNNQSKEFKIIKK